MPRTRLSQYFPVSDNGVGAFDTNSRVIYAYDSSQVNKYDLDTDTVTTGTGDPGPPTNSDGGGAAFRSSDDYHFFFPAEGSNLYRWKEGDSSWSSVASFSFSDPYGDSSFNNGVDIGPNGNVYVNATKRVGIWNGSSVSYTNNFPTGPSGSDAFYRGAIAVDSTGTLFHTGGKEYQASIEPTTRKWDGSSWTLLADMPQPLHKHDLGVNDNDDLYAFGGYGGSSSNNGPWKYDQSSDSWSDASVNSYTGTNFPSAMYDPTSSDNKFYILEGGKFQDLVYRKDATPPNAPTNLEIDPVGVAGN